MHGAAFASGLLAQRSRIPPAERCHAWCYPPQPYRVHPTKTFLVRGRGAATISTTMRRWRQRAHCPLRAPMACDSDWHPWWCLLRCLKPTSTSPGVPLHERPLCSERRMVNMICSGARWSRGPWSLVAGSQNSGGGRSLLFLSGVLGRRLSV